LISSEENEEIETEIKEIPKTIRIDYLESFIKITKTWIQILEGKTDITSLKNITITIPRKTKKKEKEKKKEKKTKKTGKKRKKSSKRKKKKSK